MAAKAPTLVPKYFAERTPAPPVNVAAGTPVIVVVLFDAVELKIASQVVKFWPPKNTPTVCASLRCIIWSTLAAKVALVAQKLMVKLNAVAAPLHTGVAVVPSESPVRLLISIFIVSHALEG